MIKTVNVLDLQRGDTVVIAEGKGRHRGEAADAGCIDIIEVAISTSAASGVLTHGRHSRRRPLEPYVTFEGCGDDWLHDDAYSVPFDTDLMVLR